MLSKSRRKVGVQARISAIGLGLFGLSLIGFTYLVGDRIQSDLQRDLDAAASLGSVLN
jgi:hypothetical protein